MSVDRLRHCQFATHIFKIENTATDKRIAQLVLQIFTCESYSLIASNSDHYLHLSRKGSFFP